MNENAPHSSDDFLAYQGSRFQDLLTQMVSCCEDRKLYESRRFGLPYAELKCLMLFKGERYLTAKGLSQSLDVAKSRVSKIVESLNRKGHLQSVEDPKDGRVKLFSLTPEGQRKAQEIIDFQREVHQRVLSHLDPEDRKKALFYMELVHSAMEAVKSELV